MSTPLPPAAPAAAPTAGPKSIDFAKPFTFAFEDPEWLTKVGITLAVFFGSMLTMGCLFVGLAGFALLYGYQRRVALRTMQGQPGLPDWDAWEDDLREGAKLMVVRLVWGLPGALMLGLAYAAFLLGALAGQDSGPPTWALALAGVFGCLGAPLTLLGAIGGEIGVVRCIEKGELAAGFRVGEMVRFARENLVNLLLLLVVVILSGMIAQMAGLVLCGIGILFTPGWIFLPTGQAIGQVLQADRAHRTTSSAAVFT